jgi:hypothetical protein
MCPPVHINSVQLPQEENVINLGLHLDMALKKHFRKTETTRNHPHQDVLVTRRKVKILYKQQTSHI